MAINLNAFANGSFQMEASGVHNGIHLSLCLTGKDQDELIARMRKELEAYFVVYKNLFDEINKCFPEDIVKINGSYYAVVKENGIEKYHRLENVLIEPDKNKEKL